MSIERDPGPFPRAEYLERLARVKQRMQERGLEALLVIDASNIYYLTGYSGHSGGLPQLALIQSGVEEPLIFVRKQDVSGALHTVFMDRSRITGYPENYIGNPDVNGFDFIIDRLLDCGLAGKRIGFEADAVAASDANHFYKRFKGHELVDATGLVTWVRIVKSPLELQLIRQAAQICDHAIARAVEVIRPGVRECDAAGEILRALCRGTPEFGGHRFEQPLMSAGTKTGTAHLSWSDRPYRAGQSANVELGAFRYRYAGAIMRTISLGTPPDRLRRLHEANAAGMEAALAAARPGATCGDVAQAFCDVTQRHGFIKDSRCGYSIGIDWTEPTASLRIGDRTELKPNMTFHLMLGMWIDEDFGYVASETFRVTETGSESFANTPRELFVV